MTAAGTSVSARAGLVLVSAPVPSRPGTRPASFWRFAGAPAPGRGRTPVLALPGLGLDGRVFRRLDFLARDRDWVLVNLPNRLGPARPGMQDLAAHALDALDAAGYAGQPAVIAGSSIGGMVALQVARARPDRVKGLVLIGTCGTRCHLPPRLRALTWVHPLVPRRLYTRVFAAVMLPPHKYRDDPEGRAELRMQMLHRTKGFIGGCLAALEEFDVRGDLAGLAVPALLVHGTDDTVIPAAAGRALAAALPRARLVEMPDGGHLPHFTHPGPTGEAISRFLTEERL